MKKICILLLCLFWFVSCQGTDNVVDNSWTDTMIRSSIWTIEYLDFKQKSESGDFILIDIRTSGEVSSWTIPWVDMYLDFYSKDFYSKIDALDKTKKYLVYCRSWNRSWKLLDYVKDKWFTYFYDLDWGIGAWK